MNIGTYNIDNRPLQLAEPSELRIWQNFPYNWEPSTLIAINRFANKKGNSLDIGAWIGMSTILISKRCDQLYSFEPNELANKILNKNIKINNIYNTKVYKAAITDKTGIVKLRKTNCLGVDSIFVEDDEEKFSVESYNLLDFINKNNIDNINFIKMDVEGAEFIILPTIKDYILKNKINFHIEIHNIIKRDYKTICDFFEIFEKVDFSYINEDNSSYKFLEYYDKTKIKEKIEYLYNTKCKNYWLTGSFN